MLQRRSALTRTGGPKPRPGYRIPQRSARKRAENRAAVHVVEAAGARDRGCILARAGLDDVFGQCFGRLTPHHLRKAWKGPGWTLDNIVILCLGHNGRVEDHPDIAHEHGLVVREGETTADAWTRMAAHGIGAR